MRTLRSGFRRCVASVLFSMMMFSLTVNPVWANSEVSHSAVVEELDESSTWIVRWAGSEEPAGFRKESEIVRESTMLGYVIARPNPGQDLNQWLTKWRTSDNVQYIERNQRVTIQEDRLVDRVLENESQLINEQEAGQLDGLADDVRDKSVQNDIPPVKINDRNAAQSTQPDKPLRIAAPTAPAADAPQRETTQAPMQATPPHLPDDPHLAKQEYLKRIGAYEAWGATIDGGAGITVAIVDTGIDLTHPDLKDNLVKGVNLLRKSAQPQDDNGHGTSVAGIVAAAANNSEGTAGIAPKANLMPIKALEANGEGDEDKLAEGIRYAVDNGADIVVLSVGLYRYSKLLKEVADYAEQKGVLLVAATGNDSKVVKYPAAYPTVLAVGGSTRTNRIEKSSNYGPEVDLVAPFEVFTTKLGGNYGYNEGTSMSAPQAAAAAALILEKYAGMPPHEVRNLLRQTSQDIESKGWDSFSGYGLLRIDRALTELGFLDIFKPNDTIQTAKPLPVQTLNYATIEKASDRGWFVLDAPYDGKIRLTIHSDSPGAKSLQLTHYTTTNTSNGKVYNDITEQIVELDVTKGKSWVQIRLAIPQVQRPIVFSVLTQFVMYKDAFVDSDKQYKAYVLPTRSQRITGTFQKPNEQKWFMLDVTQTGTLNIAATSSTPRMDLAITIQKKAERPLKIDIGGDGEAEFVPTLTLSPGQYYIMVENVNTDNPLPVIGEYTLDIDFKLKFTDPNEPNDKLFQGVSMVQGRDYKGVIHPKGDFDWYSFKLDTKSYVMLGLKEIPTDRILSFGLFDSSQKQLEMTFNKLGTSKAAIETLLEAGTYYVRLSANEPFEHQMYALNVAVEPLVGGFRDISTHWARQAITDLSGKNIVSGYGNYIFAPERYISRAEAVSMIVQAFELQAKADLAAYKDVPAKHWAHSKIAIAKAQAIVEGYPDGTFQPDSQVTREEMAVMIAKALKMKPTAPGRTPFTDTADERWSTPFLRVMKAEGMISGFPDGDFRPTNFATRAEFASLLTAALKKKK